MRQLYPFTFGKSRSRVAYVYGEGPSFVAVIDHITGMMLFKVTFLLSLLPLLFGTMLSASPAVVPTAEGATSPDSMPFNLTAGGPIP